jgi:hypothetical protein
MVVRVTSAWNLTYTFKSDVYSFAMVMWQVLTRKEPWAGFDQDSLRTFLRRGERLQIPVMNGS